MIRSPESQGLLADLKRERSSTLEKPVLSEEAFQRLLSAAYILQEHNGRRLVKEPNQGPLPMVPRLWRQRSSNSRGRTRYGPSR
jgi:hypothetical protein